MISGVGDIAVAVITVAAVYMLVRPQSSAAALITAITDLWVGLVRTVTGAGA